MNAAEHKEAAELLIEQTREIGEMVEKHRDALMLDPQRALSVRIQIEQNLALAAVHAQLAQVPDPPEWRTQAWDIMSTPDPGRVVVPAARWTSNEADTPKMIIETLSVAQSAIGTVQSVDRGRHMRRLQRLIDAAYSATLPTEPGVQ